MIRAQQVQCFEAQLQLAKELQLPVNAWGLGTLGNDLGQTPGSLKRPCVVVGKGEDLARFSTFWGGMFWSVLFWNRRKTWTYGFLLLSKWPVFLCHFDHCSRVSRFIHAMRKLKPWRFWAAMTFLACSGCDIRKNEQWKNPSCWGYIGDYPTRAARGGGGSFKNRKRIGKIRCCESQLSERKHSPIVQRSNSLTISELVS